jgi:hypothetical protein
MEISSFLSGVLITVVGGFILIWAMSMIERPELEISNSWISDKWVGQVIRRNFYSTSSGVEIVGDGDDYRFYGITLKNKKRWILPRKTAYIRNTTITVFDAEGNQVVHKKECRWWTYYSAEVDNLFVSEKVEIDKRRNENIPEGVERSLVIAYNPKGQQSYYLFGIDSDRIGVFHRADERFKGISPYFALLNISGDGIDSKFKLRITPPGGFVISLPDGELLIERIDKFPFE